MSQEEKVSYRAFEDTISQLEERLSELEAIQSELKETLINTDTLGIVYLKGQIAELRLKVESPPSIFNIYNKFNELKEQFAKWVFEFGNKTLEIDRKLGVFDKIDILQTEIDELKENIAGLRRHIIETEEKDLVKRMIKRGVRSDKADFIIYDEPREDDMPPPYEYITITEMKEYLKKYDRNNIIVKREDLQWLYDNLNRGFITEFGENHIRIRIKEAYGIE